MSDFSAKLDGRRVVARDQEGPYFAYKAKDDGLVLFEILREGEKARWCLEFLAKETQKWRPDSTPVNIAEVGERMHEYVENHGDPDEGTDIDIPIYDHAHNDVTLMTVTVSKKGGEQDTINREGMAT